jgi:hypothetical protein
MQAIIEHQLGSTYETPKLDFSTPQKEAAVDSYKRQLESPETTVFSPFPNAEEINKRFLGIYNLISKGKSISPPRLPIFAQSQKTKPGKSTQDPANPTQTIFGLSPKEYRKLQATPIGTVRFLTKKVQKASTRSQATKGRLHQYLKLLYPPTVQSNASWLSKIELSGPIAHESNQNPRLSTFELPTNLTSPRVPRANHSEDTPFHQKQTSPVAPKPKDADTVKTLEEVAKDIPINTASASISQEKALVPSVEPKSSITASPSSQANSFYQGSREASSSLSDAKQSEEGSEESITVEPPKKKARPTTLASAKKPKGIGKQKKESRRKKPSPAQPAVKPETATKQLPPGAYTKGGWTYNLDEPSSDTELNSDFSLRRIISSNRHILINKKPLPNARYVETGIYPHDGDSLKTALDQEVSFDLTALKQDVKKIGGSFDKLLSPIAGTRKRRIHNARPKDQRKPKKGT